MQYYRTLKETNRMSTTSPGPQKHHPRVTMITDRIRISIPVLYYYGAPVIQQQENTFPRSRKRSGSYVTVTVRVTSWYTTCVCDIIFVKTQLLP